METLTLRELIQYWEFHNQTEGKSPKTIAWYNKALALFERLLTDGGRTTLIEQTGEQEVWEFIRHLQTERKWSKKSNSATRDVPLAPEGIQNRVRALKAFFAWLERKEPHRNEPARARASPRFRRARRRRDRQGLARYRPAHARGGLGTTQS